MTLPVWLVRSCLARSKWRVLVTGALDAPEEVDEADNDPLPLPPP
jgi:hypothetical protein